MKVFGLRGHDLCQGLHGVRSSLREIDKTDSFANSLFDKRYQEFVETFNFAREATTTIFDRTRQSTVDATSARRGRGCGRAKRGVGWPSI